MTRTILTPGQAFSMSDYLTGRPVAFVAPDGGETAPRTVGDVDMDRRGILVTWEDGTSARPAAGNKILVLS